MEIQFTLSSFGIPRKTLPVGILGKINTQEHQAFLDTQRSNESPRVVVSNLQDVTLPSSDVATAGCSVVVPVAETVPSSLGPSRQVPTEDTDSDRPKDCFPTGNDVLFGRGRVKDHPGNILLHRLIAERRQRYEDAEKWEKTVIAEEIVAIIRERSGRFLKPDKRNVGSWVAVDVETAREKVSHTFRSGRSKSANPQPRKGRRNSIENPEAKRQRQNGFAFPYLAF